VELKGDGKMRKSGLILAGLAVLVVAGFLALSYTGGQLIRTRIEQAMRPGLRVGKINVKLTHLSLKEIQYEDPISMKRVCQIEEMKIYPSLLAVLGGGRTVQIRKCMILGPSFFLHRSREGVFTGPFPKAGKEGTTPGKDQGGSPGGEKRKAEAAAVRIDRLQVEKGFIDFEDQKTEGHTAYLQLRDVDLEMKDLQYPLVPVHSPVELKGKFKGMTKEGDLSSKGWIDLHTTDMEMTLRTREIELRAFEPYYRKKVTAEISSGHVDLDARITVRKHVIDVPGEMDLVNLRVREGSGSVLYIPAKNFMRMLKDKGNRVKVRFRIKGNLDDPQFNLRENVASRLALALAESLGLPVTVVDEGRVISGERGSTRGSR
jgi:uncharacterized protein involved in outer membrane biogenesis